MPKTLKNKTKHKFLAELIVDIWIPFIIGLVLYIFWELHDVLLCMVVIIAFSAIYAAVRLYLQHKKWWLLAILPVIIAGALGYFFASSPSMTLYINGQAVNGSVVNFAEGSVSVNPAPESNSKYDKDTVVTLTASPDSGYDWQSWSGTDDDTANPATVTMSGNKQVTATFAPRFSLIINNQPVIGSVVNFIEGSVSIAPAPGADGKYAEDTVVTLTASPDSGYDWQSWSATDNASNPTTVTMNGNKQIAVTFTSRFSLVIGNQLVIGSSVSLTEGSVLIAPPPGADEKYAKDTVVTLTVSPASGYGWKSWSGTNSDTANPTTVTISSDKYVMVTFEHRFGLTINGRNVTGPSLDFAEGSILVSPAPDKDGKYAKDTKVTLTAMPAPGYLFDHWSGGVFGSDTYVTISMDADKSVFANFVIVPAP
jgi:hypothetical protein